jgi:hypothetical protein
MGAPSARVDKYSIDILSPLDEWTKGPLQMIAMTHSSSVRQIIDLWPSRPELAADLTSEADPVTTAQVNKWAQRGVIPAVYHARLLRAADRRGFAVSAGQIVAAHDQPTPSEDAA